MSTLFPFSFASPILLAAGVMGCAAAGLAVLFRQPKLSRGTLALATIGLALWALAAGTPIWSRPTAGDVAVMVDLSPSTRTAGFRTRSQLDARIRALLGTAAYRVYYFASEVSSTAPAGAVLPDLPADRTVFRPPAGAAAVVLFSDARFDLPASAPPTYVVLDPALESPTDASVRSLEIRANHVDISISNSGNARSLSLSGTAGNRTASARPGSYVLTRPLLPTSTSVSARLAPGDPWPENDQLAATVLPADHRERWWVGASNPGTGWRVMRRGDLPTAAADYLIPDVIVLENIAASELGALRQQRLRQYVRDLGGGLVILGGDRAFAAGAYPGSALEAISPLASTPPDPTSHWILLADSSGSMAQVQGGFSLWHFATDAIVRLIPHLPPNDLLTVGSFAEGLTWWSTGKTVRQTQSMAFPPAEVGPHGPTNLEQALMDVARGASGDLPAHLLLITDADAEIRDPAGLGLALKQKKIRLHLLAIGEGSGLPALRIVIGATGGSIVRQFEPSKWADSIRQLMRSAAPKRLGRDALAVTFTGELAPLAPQNAMPWNHVWLKAPAAELAHGSEDGQHIAAGAVWNVGEGRVLALAFDPTASDIGALTRAATRAPRDPRYRVTWNSAATLRVALDAMDGDKYLNGLHPRLELSHEAESTPSPEIHSIPQTSPGRYELELPAPRDPTFAAVRVEGHLADRIALAGRYAPEFDAIGNDHDAMRTLARRTGGAVIPPRQIWPIDFRWPARPVPLTSLLAAVGAAFVAMGLVWRKIRQ